MQTIEYYYNDQLIATSQVDNNTPLVAIASNLSFFYN
jgi:hypothetical protein